MEHRRGVHSGALRTGSAGGGGRQDERTRSGQGVRAGSRDGAEDAAVRSPARLRTEEADSTTEAGPWLGIIDQILVDDKTQHKKQRHTAKRIWDRLKAEHGFGRGYTIVKDYVRQARLRHKEGRGDRACPATSPQPSPDGERCRCRGWSRCKTADTTRGCE